MTLQDVKDYVIPNNFGVQQADFGANIFISNGIKYALENENKMAAFVENALNQVDAEDYGDFYEPGEEPRIGDEYYLCPSPFGTEINKGIVVHREQGVLKMYFQFER